MKIYLIRHGETTGDLEGRYGGDYDDHLTDEGIQQGIELGEKLSGSEIEIIYTSPRHRAVETANILSQKINASVKQVTDIRERNSYGVLSGLTKTEAQEQFPDDLVELGTGKFTHSVTNSDNYADFMARTFPAIEKIMSENTSQTIAIIAHGGVINGFYRDFLKLGELGSLGDCAIIELEYDGENTKFISIDNTNKT